MHGPGASPTVAAPVAVAVRGACKSYTGDDWVLDGLDMTVPEASIYALLGSSGCGKTTLLTCIMGLRRLNGGHISVMGWRPGDRGAGIPGPRVGYMPQELALSEGFSIAETMTYFGRVAGLADDAIKSRSRELLKFLDIPAKQSRLVSELSGGQRQRVSMAVTLLHSPPLLIMDEPTVGVDPILRQSIWDFLVELTRTSRTTVLITTHYIEEARQASRVGLMRRGRLLDEDHPEAIMRRQGCATLEDVFLGLSKRQDRWADDAVEVAVEAVEAVDGLPDVASTEQQSWPETRYPEPQQVKSAPLKKRSNVLVCLWRAALYFRRYKMVTAYALLMPVACLVVFMYSVGLDPRGVRVALVNDDAPEQCGAWPGYPDGCEDGAVAGLSCRFLDLLLDSNDFIMDPYSTEGAARRAVQTGAAWGLVHFPANFSYHMARRQVMLQDADEEDVDGSEVTVHIDMSNQYLGNMVRGALQRTALRFHDDLQRGCGLNPRLGAVPIAEMEPVYGQREPSFQEFALPGLLLCVIYFPSIFYSMAGLLEDKLTGVMSRSAAAGVTEFEMLWARAALDSLMNALATAIVLFFVFVVFQFHNGGSFLPVVCLLYLMGLLGLWIGYFVAALCSYHFTATYLSMGIFLGTSFLSGMFWPMQGMHWLLKLVAPLTPMMPAVEGVRTVLFQGSNGLVIAHGFAAVVGWTLLLMLATLGLVHLQRTVGSPTAVTLAALARLVKRGGRGGRGRKGTKP